MNNEEKSPLQPLPFPVRVFPGGSAGTMKKLSIGKKTMGSVTIQVSAILNSLHRTEVTIDSIEPVRFDHGNYFLVTFHMSHDPSTHHSRYFAHQKVRDCCDVWLESPTVLASGPETGNAA
jgi:hypothetical protein